MSKPRILVIGPSTHINHDLLRALMMIEGVQIVLPAMTVPAASAEPDPIDFKQMLADMDALRMREWDPTPEPTWFPDERRRRGKGEKRRLKKMRGW